MKKQMKKLVLSRETLVRLEENLGQVAGGLTNNPQICGDSGVNTCQTFVQDLRSDLSLLTLLVVGAAGADPPSWHAFTTIHAELGQDSREQPSSLRKS